MNIPKKLVIKIKKGLTGLITVCGVIASLLMMVIFLDAYKMEKDIVFLSFLFFINISVAFFTFKVYQIYKNAKSSKTIQLFKKTQKKISDKEKERLILEQIRLRALKVDQENKKQREVKQLAAANLDALESVTDLSRDELEEMEQKIRHEFNKKHV
jgi:K+ transporter